MLAQARRRAADAQRTADLASAFVPGLAQGGIVPATPGGRLVNVGEGGEAEAIIPLSRMQERQRLDVTIRVEGDDERIIEVVNVAADRGNLNVQVAT